MSLDDENFNTKKKLILQSKMLTKVAKERGLAIKIPDTTMEEEFIVKIHDLPGVTSLNGEYCSCTSNAALLEVGRSCKDLESFNVFEVFRDISHEALQNTLQSLKKLKRLNMLDKFGTSGDAVDDSTLETIADNCKELEVLDLVGCIISDFGIQRLAQSLLRLKSLNLRACISLTNDGLTNMIKYLMNLKILNLSCIPHLEDRVLIEIAGRCENLTELHLDRSKHITDQAIIELAMELPRLKTIHLSCCANIGNQTLSALGKYSKELERISVSLCPNISDYGLKALLEGCSKLNYVECFRTKVTKGLLKRASKKYQYIKICH